LEIFHYNKLPAKIIRIKQNLTEYTDDEFIAIATKRLEQEGVDSKDLALYIANSVLRGLGRKSLRDVIRIARKYKKLEEVDETIQTLKRYERM
jgi:hypothetical protein